MPRTHPIPARPGPASARSPLPLSDKAVAGTTGSATDVHTTHHTD